MESVPLVPCPLALRVQEPPVIEIDPDGDLLLNVGRVRCIAPDNFDTAEMEEDSDEESEEESETDHGEGFTEDPVEDPVEELEEQAEDEAEREAGEDAGGEPGKEADEAHEEQEAGVAEGPELACEKHGHTSRVTFRVCSRTLARSSPVWKKMLLGGFAESKPKDGDWIVKLPADNITAVEFFLNTIHARFDTIPAFLDEPDPDWMYEVTVIADKYDNVRLLRPWAGGWVEQILRHVRGGVRDIPALEKYLWILWVLGAKSEFTKIVRYIVMASGEEDPVQDVLEPPGISKIIANMRQALLAKVLFPFQDALNKLSLGGQHYRYSCKAGTSGCEEVMLGKLIRSLNKQQLWPFPQASDVLVSVNDLVDILNKVDQGTVRSIHREYAALNIGGPCEKVLDQPMCHSSLRGHMRVLLTDYQQTQIEEHGRATGLATTGEEPAKKRAKLSH